MVHSIKEITGGGLGKEGGGGGLGWGGEDS